MNRLLLLLFLISSPAFGEVIKPEIIYIEQLIEKEVNWPTYVTLKENLVSTEGPSIQVHIGIPDLLRLKSNGTTYQINNVQKDGSPFPNSYTVKDYISFETGSHTTLLELQRPRKAESESPTTALKVSFSRTGPLLALSRRCHSLYDVEAFEPTGPIPFITHLSCPETNKIVVKTTPEVEMVGSKKSRTYNLLEVSIQPHAPRSAIKISPRITAEGDEDGELNLLLRSKGDVLYSFEQARTRRGGAKTRVENLDLAQITSVGVTLSEYDPEIFGSVDFKKEDWKNYFKLRGEFSLPYFLTGHSVKNPIDGRVYLLINRPLTSNSSERRYSFGLGAEVLKRAPESTYYAIGPKAQFSAEKVLSWNSRNHLGLFLSTSALSRTPLQWESPDYVHELEARLTHTLPTGKYFEPRLVLQSFHFDNAHKDSLFVFKVGLGARF